MKTVRVHVAPPSPLPTLPPTAPRTVASSPPPLSTPPPLRERLAGPVPAECRIASSRPAERCCPLGKPPPRTKWTRRVHHPVLIGHAASLTPYQSDAPRPSPRTNRTRRVPLAGGRAPLGKAGWGAGGLRWAGPSGRGRTPSRCPRPLRRPRPGTPRGTIRQCSRWRRVLVGLGGEEGLLAAPQRT